MKESEYNRPMQKILISSLIFTIIALSSWGALLFGTGRWYTEYLADWEYRRLHPELIPPVTIVRAFDMGHTTSYASFVWLELIQYIGDNVRDNRFLGFSHTILKQITTLHPYFTRPYEIDLIFAPLSAWENTTPEQKAKNKIAAKNAIELGQKWLTILCDTTKIEKIKEQEISENLWNNESLKNPCASGMLPYYLGFTTYQMGENKAKAAEYYKIASMNDDSPKASRVLSILALSAEWDYMASATNFALIGSTGYDREPYTCQTLANSLIEDIIKKRKVDIFWIRALEQIEKNLKDTQDENNPISNSSNNCYDMTTRSIKEIYLSYIAGIAAGTTAKNGDELIRLGKLKSIPTLSTHTGYSVRLKNGIWEYQAR